MPTVHMVKKRPDLDEYFSFNLASLTENVFWCTKVLEMVQQFWTHWCIE